jgi:hypothetical protein
MRFSEPIRARNRKPSHLLMSPLACCVVAILLVGVAHAEVCTTQSGLSEPDRKALAAAASSLAIKVQANDTASLRAQTIAEFAKDFGSMQSLISATAPRIAGDTLSVDQVYLLDASDLKKNADGSPADAQFFCSLNRSTMEADFLIPALPAGRYAFAMVNASTASATFPWRLSFLLRQDQGQWQLAGFYPKPLTAAGHDGLWYWVQARDLAKQKQPWNAWLYYQAATMLLRPADFVLSTHLDKLRTETSAAAPPALSDGISVDAPLVVKGANGTEYHFTSLTVDDSLGQSSLDLALRLRLDLPAQAAQAQTVDPAAARKLNSDAMSALLTAYPELRKPFHGVWVFAEAAGRSPIATELPMADIH